MQNLRSCTAHQHTYTYQECYLIPRNHSFSHPCAVLLALLAKPPYSQAGAGTGGTIHLSCLHEAFVQPLVLLGAAAWLLPTLHPTRCWQPELLTLGPQRRWCNPLANGRFRSLKEPRSKVSAKVVLLKYDVVKV